MLFDLIVTVIVGGFIGWLASIFMKTRGQMGLFADIIVGIVGSAIGRALFGVLGLHGYGLIASLIMSVIGAMALIAMLKGLKVYR